MLAYMGYLMISFNDTLTNDIVSFEQLGPGALYSGSYIKDSIRQLTHAAQIFIALPLSNSRGPSVFWITNPKVILTNNVAVGAAVSNLPT